MSDSAAPPPAPSSPAPPPKRPGTIVGRLAQALRTQNWAAVGIELVIVILGIVIGFQINLWNETRVEAQRRGQIIGALVTDLNDGIEVQEGFIAEIDMGLSTWERAYARGERPPPFYYRIAGSDTAPITWSIFDQTQLTDLFDPVTLFDLTLFYSELAGVGRKYIRYVTFVEDEVLPGEIAGADTFYDANGQLHPQFRANMNRLRDFQQEIALMNRWARCIVYRLETARTFAQSCGRVDFRLDGMAAAPREAEGAP
ncbi:MAG: hypothetical protein GVY12_14360 [Bacteroidetes bacterium]|jgi:hypothetical protein|nr:hypothetical protein [Bacteroidota bacterium]